MLGDFEQVGLVARNAENNHVLWCVQGLLMRPYGLLAVLYLINWAAFCIDTHEHATQTIDFLSHKQADLLM
jgi:hypothetical protein